MARYLTNVIIATDDERIHEEARRFGGVVRMTRSDHLSGTDRVAEVASAETAEWIVNIQGDEPLIDPGAIDAAILPLLDEPSIPMGTLKKRIEDPREIDDPNVVKVVTDRFENAIYFSRSTIPYVREKSAGEGSKGKREEERIHYKHVGLYVYRRDFLLQYPDLPVGPLEKAERLEQLRAADWVVMDVLHLGWPKGGDQAMHAGLEVGTLGEREGTQSRPPGAAHAGRALVAVRLIHRLRPAERRRR